MNATTEYDSFFNDIPQENLAFVRKLGLIMDRVDAILKLKKISRSELAARLEKKPSEISKWFNSPHNLTLKSIIKIETILDCTLIEVPELEVEFFFADDELLNYVESSITSKSENKNIQAAYVKNEEVKMIDYPLAA